MKKIIASILAASLSLCGAGALADSRISTLSGGLSSTDEIHILYNDTLVKYEDVKPINNEDRIMIPFRAALENMGAVVDYDDSERLVTASKDGITIRFTLMDNTIYIDNNGEESTITMDVPMIIVSDRTLVPIRFMSEAFGMQVGWDGGTETVVIMDYDNYFEKFSVLAPNLTALAELGNTSFNKSSYSYNITLNRDGASKPLTSDGNAVTVKNGSELTASVKLNIDSDKMSLKDASLDIILKDMKFYIQTDALKQLAKNSDNLALKAIAALTGSDTWYSIDADALLDGVGMDGGVANVLKTALSLGSFDVESVLKNGMTTEGDAVFDEALNLASQLDVYEALDKYIVIENKENGGFTASVEIKPEDFADILSSALGVMMSEETAKTLTNAVEYSIKATADNDGTKQTSQAQMTVKQKDSAQPLLDINVTSTSETEASPETAKIPDDAVDITDIAVNLLEK